MRGDIAEIKTTLNRLAPLIDEFRGFMAATLPTLATKVELAELRTELRSEMAELRVELAELRAEILQRPTRRQAIFDMFAVVGLVGAVLAIATHVGH
jgi:hypothetical protein